MYVHIYVSFRFNCRELGSLLWLIQWLVGGGGDPLPCSLACLQEPVSGREGLASSQPSLDSYPRV